MEKVEMMWRWKEKDGDGKVKETLLNSCFLQFYAFPQTDDYGHTCVKFAIAREFPLQKGLPVNDMIRWSI